MDIFEKCNQRYIQDEVRDLGIYPYFHALESRQDTEVIMEGKRRIMLGSNNYLGLTAAPEVIAAAEAALAEYGTGCSGSRFLNGARSGSTSSWSVSWPTSSTRTAPSPSRLASSPTSASSAPSSAAATTHLRTREPRQHLRRLPPLLRQDAPLPTRGHG